LKGVMRMCGIAAACPSRTPGARVFPTIPAKGKRRGGVSLRERILMALRRNILIFHQGAVGDFIVTWPLALGLARVFAQSRVFYVTAGQKGALAEKALRVESVDIESGWHQLFSSDPKLPEPAARLLNGAQQVISFVSGPEDLWAKNVRMLAPQASLVTLSTVPPDSFAGHITEYLLAQLKTFPVIEAAMGQMLRSIETRGLALARQTDKTVVLHPGAGSGKKCWPAGQFLQLVELLKGTGRHVEAILGEVELECWPAEQIAALSKVAEVKRPNSLVELMDMIAGASVFVGNDSGPGHLSGIIGTPTVSIFGPKDSARWKPLGPRVTVLRGEWEAITPRAVGDAIEWALSG
jgi:ADP-heptose:LPS heptosyltransferase